MKIPFLDLKAQYISIKKEINLAINEVCEDTAFTNSPYVERFENNFSRYCNTNYAVAVNSGTSALHLSMIALGIGKDDEVIIPANTFIATAWAPSYVGAIPVFVDCCPYTWQIDPEQIKKKITNKTKAIIGVHLYGQPFDIDAVKEIAKEYNLFLVEDAAQAHGAEYKGRRVGGFSEMACFSFYPGKNLGTYGEGGCITTNNQRYANRLRSLRNHGSTKKYYYDEIGYNMRMGGIEGAVLNIKLKYLDQWNRKRKEIAKVYHENIKNLKIKMQKQNNFTDSVFHLFIITTEDSDSLIKYMNSKNIYPGKHYPVPCHLQKAFNHLKHSRGDFLNSEYLADNCVSLPMYPELKNQEVDKIINLLNNY